MFEEIHLLKPFGPKTFFVRRFWSRNSVFSKTIQVVCTYVCMYVCMIEWALVVCPCLKFIHFILILTIPDINTLNPFCLYLLGKLSKTVINFIEIFFKSIFLLFIISFPISLIYTLHYFVFLFFGFYFVLLVS